MLPKRSGVREDREQQGEEWGAAALALAVSPLSRAGRVPPHLSLWLSWRQLLYKALLSTVVWRRLGRVPQGQSHWPPVSKLGSPLSGPANGRASGLPQWSIWGLRHSWAVLCSKGPFIGKGLMATSSSRDSGQTAQLRGAQGPRSARGATRLSLSPS